MQGLINRALGEAKGNGDADASTLGDEGECQIIDLTRSNQYARSNTVCDDSENHEFGDRIEHGQNPAATPIVNQNLASMSTETRF